MKKGGGSYGASPLHDGQTIAPGRKNEMTETACLAIRDC